MHLFTKLLVLALLPVATAFASGKPQVAVLDVQKIQCYGCLNTVRKALQKVPGVEDTKIDLEKKAITVQFDPAKTNTEALVKATANAGFPSTVKK